MSIQVTKEMLYPYGSLPHIGLQALLGAWKSTFPLAFPKIGNDTNMSWFANLKDIEEADGTHNWWPPQAIQFQTKQAAWRPEDLQEVWREDLKARTGSKLWRLRWRCFYVFFQTLLGQIRYLGIWVADGDQNISWYIIWYGRRFFCCRVREGASFVLCLGHCPKMLDPNRTAW